MGLGTGGVAEHGGLDFYGSAAAIAGLYVRVRRPRRQRQFRNWVAARAPPRAGGVGRGRIRGSVAPPGAGFRRRASELGATRATPRARRLENVVTHVYVRARKSLRPRNATGDRRCPSM